MVMKVYSPEFKADAVALYLSEPSHTLEGVGKDLGISRETLHNWVRAEPRDSYQAAPAGDRGGITHTWPSPRITWSRSG